ncbi:phosphoribosylformylglycinamidine synthase [Dehalobacter sp. DCM]|uniref:phosphoribosylformylglycinamidine synthase n=1 Tax=Dehalobacter sp. DCM TaxID=2907827 RepID=UPI003081B6C3|nr:phosphoribosylformylglycinamidine synthase [Dehalobacter sp. DCM]
MKEAVRRVFVEKKPGFDIEAQGLYKDLRDNLGISGLQGVRTINRYDIAGVTDDEYKQALHIIFAELPVDILYEETVSISTDDKVFAMEYLPGQYDQRADSAAQCIQMLTQKERPLVATAKVIVLNGTITDQEFDRIKEYCVNPVESREATMAKPQSLEFAAEEPDDVAVLEGFNGKTAEEIIALQQSMGLAMSVEDLLFCQAYFRDTEKRNPTMTEIKTIDTYWSDHCRHTTFQTKIEDVIIQDGRFTAPIKTAHEIYHASRADVYGDKLSAKDICLMDIATIGMKELKKAGKLDDLDESDEINACSIVVNAEINGQDEEWLVMFKNETHNHPTEIEPFGGAATCLGGAIRDPLSGRTYVYQAMRVTGSGDPRAKIQDTLPGKLPQRKITTVAADGYSSYGNQIGLATGQVAEVYDEGFIAKRMEIGAVIGAAPRKNVVRKAPVEGDVVVLVGGRTGRDGCGGATGSSKEHTIESLTSCGAEVQKGNPPNERKIQRLFRNPEASTLIKKCNDFGAGGVSVAVGELTDGLDICLDAVPKKYESLDGTELAISESQERMAVVLAAEDWDRFKSLAADENLEATIIARVTMDNRLRMSWRGKTILDLSRDFLNTNGVKQKTKVEVTAPSEKNNYFETVTNVVAHEISDINKAWTVNLNDLNVCSKKGLIERFDSTIGAATVLMPLSGKYQLTPSEGMVAKLPVFDGETTTATIMTYGYNPQLAKWSPFHGALYAVLDAVAKLVALGGDYRQTRLTLQEYFGKLTDATKWGQPFSALLGAYYAQKMLGIPAIGGKDSMSGSFMDLTVPPTLVAFAVCTTDARHVVSQEFKQTGTRVVMVKVTRDEYEIPDFALAMKNFQNIFALIRSGCILSSRSVRKGGIAGAVSEMAFGNMIGFEFSQPIPTVDLFSADYGSILLEIKEDVDLSLIFGDVSFDELGRTTEKPAIVVNGSELPLTDLLTQWEMPLEKVFPSKVNDDDNDLKPRLVSFDKRTAYKPAIKIAQPRVFIPVFPGTNCEYDSAKAFIKAGGLVETMVIRNLSSTDVENTIIKMAKAIDNSQIIMLPGGFSAGDEPDGSGKFIATLFNNPRIKDAVMNLLKQRDGLMLGICNGFQALIKLGLVPYGEIKEIKTEDPTLTYNKIGRHVSCMVRTKVVSTLSPWFSGVELGEIHTIPVSHGEGRFVAGKDVIEKLIQNGQIATQYVDFDGNPSNDIMDNPNGSYETIEGITSPDGRILGKMGHSERTGSHIALNVPGNKYQPIFEGGINYFK